VRKKDTEERKWRDGRKKGKRRGKQGRENKK